MSSEQEDDFIVVITLVRCSVVTDLNKEKTILYNRPVCVFISK